jgi:hypothetical protein
LRRTRIPNLHREIQGTVPVEKTKVQHPLTRPDLQPHNIGKLLADPIILVRNCSCIKGVMWVAEGQKAGITPRRIDGIQESLVPSLEVIR